MHLRLVRKKQIEWIFFRLFDFAVQVEINIVQHDDTKGALTINEKFSENNCLQIRFMTPL